jgi:hypothetical protein
MNIVPQQIKINAKQSMRSLRAEDTATICKHDLHKILKWKGPTSNASSLSYMNQSNPKIVAPYEEKILNLKGIPKKSSCPNNSNYLFEYHVVNLVSMNVVQNRLTQTQ